MTYFSYILYMHSIYIFLKLCEVDSGTTHLNIIYRFDIIKYNLREVWLNFVLEKLFYLGNEVNYLENL